MRRECKTLHQKAVDSLLLAVDHFNRAWDRGRTEAVLILFDRAFELLLKAIIVHKAGGDAIREKDKDGMTISFDRCLRKCLSDDDIRCLTEDDVVALQSLNTLRDAAQHYMIELSEEHLYVYARSAMTLFGRLSKEVLGRPLLNEIPNRVLPICAKPPSELAALFDVEFADIRRMVAPGSRRGPEAKSKLRSLAILQASLDGRKTQPSDAELDQVVRRIRAGDGWRRIFPGVETLTIVPEVDGPGLSLRISKKEGEAVHLVKDDSPDATVVAVKRVNELDHYSMGAKDLSKKLSLTMHRTLQLISNYKLQLNPNFFKLIKIGKQKYKRYSGSCLDYLQQRLKEAAETMH